MAPRGTALALTALLSVLLVGCFGDEETTEPEPTAAAESGDFEELSGAEIPDAAESVEVSSAGDGDSLSTYVATFTPHSEEDAKVFWASANIGNYRTVVDGEPNEEQNERHFIEKTELVDPHKCSSAQQGENVDHSVVFSFLEGVRVFVWAITEEIGWQTWLRPPPWG